MQNYYANHIKSTERKMTMECGGIERSDKGLSKGKLAFYRKLLADNVSFRKNL